MKLPRLKPQVVPRSNCLVPEELDRASGKAGAGVGMAGFRGASGGGNPAPSDKAGRGGAAKGPRFLPLSVH